jgi:hypothetical protein
VTFNPDDPHEHDNQQAPRRLIADGGCIAVLRAAQFAETKKGDEQIVLGFEITDPSRPDEVGMHISYFGTFGPNSIDFTVDAIRACGWTGDDVSEVPALAEAGQLANEVRLKIEHETYEGKLRAKVKFVNKVGGGAKIKLERTLDDDRVKRFAASMKSRIRAAGRDGAQAGSRPPAQQQTQRSTAPRSSGGYQGGGAHPNAPGNNDDIPFLSCDLHAEPSSLAPVLRRLT